MWKTLDKCGEDQRFFLEKVGISRNVFNLNLQNLYIRYGRILLCWLLFGLSVESRFALPVLGHFIGHDCGLLHRSLSKKLFLTGRTTIFVKLTKYTCFEGFTYSLTIKELYSRSISG